MLQTLPNGLARVKEVQVGELPVEEMHKAECIPALRITRARAFKTASVKTPEMGNCCKI